MSTLSLWWCNDSSSQVWFSAFSMLPSKKMCWTCDQKQIEISRNLNATQSKKMGEKKALPQALFVFKIPNHQFIPTQQWSDPINLWLSTYSTHHGVSHDAFVSARSTNSNLPAPLSRSCASQNLTSRHGRGTRARLEMSRGSVKQWVSQGSTKGWRVWRTSLDIWYL